ncbi:anti-repressor SinI family protein [Salipaludibacillus sp. HK11]|uniref:anti-repressor SinI family protein n=1 Tax=Salipaludibacillus sp. HK11 TaxID=3394320 RepID=UPI0039FC5ECF
MENTFGSTLDKEWVKLMEEAREIGMTPEDVLQFFNHRKSEKSFIVLNDQKGNVS